VTPGPPATTGAGPPLRAGAEVLVVAPAGPVVAERLERGGELLRSWGLRVRWGESVRAATGHGHAFLAGDDATRLVDLLRGLTDPDVAAVLCARGGHGCARLLPGLLAALPAAPASPPTVLLGSSDVTALHAGLAGRPDVVRLFGPMVATDVLAGDDPDPATRADLRAHLLGAGAAPLLGTPVVGGLASGPVEGGTVTLLASLLGTPYALPPAGGSARILVLEDVAEAPYRLDRMLTQLTQAGAWAGVRGVALGSFQDCGHPDEVRRVLLGHLAPLGVPVVAGLPFGHGRPQRVLRLGATYRLDGAGGTLTPDSAG
jgi:muramoyltetrapeptide carboxypeptidase